MVIQYLLFLLIILYFILLFQMKVVDQKKNMQTKVEKQNENIMITVDIVKYFFTVCIIFNLLHFIISGLVAQKMNLLDNLENYKKKIMLWTLKEPAEQLEEDNSGLDYYFVRLVKHKMLTNLNSVQNRRVQLFLTAD